MSVVFWRPEMPLLLGVLSRRSLVWEFAVKARATSLPSAKRPAQLKRAVGNWPFHWLKREGAKSQTSARSQCSIHLQAFQEMSLESFGPRLSRLNPTLTCHLHRMGFRSPASESNSISPFQPTAPDRGLGKPELPWQKDRLQA